MIAPGHMPHGGARLRMTAGRISSTRALVAHKAPDQLGPVHNAAGGVSDTLVP